MTAKNRILVALKVAGQRGCTTAELCGPDVGGVRFGGRIMELRRAGYEIEAFYVRRGSHRYVLVSEPAEVSPTARHGGAVGADLGAEECSQTQAPAPPDETNDGRFPSGGEGEGLFDGEEFERKPKHDEVLEDAA